MEKNDAPYGNPYAGYDALEQNEQPERQPVTAQQRWLLLGAVAIGFAVQQAFARVFTYSAQYFTMWYAAIWIVYLAVFHIWMGKRAISRRVAIPFAAVAAFLLVMITAQVNGYSDPSLPFLNMLIAPALLMLHAQAVIHPLPPQRESEYFGFFFYGFFVQPFKHIGRFFGAAASLFRGGGQSRMVWIGVLVALPVVGVVLALLLSADAVMRSFAENIFRGWDIGEYFWRGMLLALAALLFYSFLYGAKWASPEAGGRGALRERLPLWPSMAPRVVVGALLLVYLLFTGIQFLYLFGGYGLPAHLTYAEYAREGFYQLIWVACINLAVFSVCLCRVREDALLRALLVALLAATAVILASSFTRLFLYIGAYALTFKRIQAFWLLCYISVVIVLCGIRLYKKELPLLRWCMLLLVFWYAALNVPDLNALYALQF